MMKYHNFQLDWNINNIKDFNDALDIFDSWAESGAVTGEDVRVKDVIKNQDPDLYDRLSRGDKCRVGKAVSNRYEKHMYSGIVRGNDKGATKTYRKS
ncbi:MAG TPA: hypothetical protein P5092_00200 [Ruminococcus sp.]|nr:hypothetical protein [Ruminococcus sp.]